jgi:hypothetical protein
MPGQPTCHLLPSRQRLAYCPLHQAEDQQGDAQDQQQPDDAPIAGDEQWPDPQRSLGAAMAVLDLSLRLPLGQQRAGIPASAAVRVVSRT